MTKLVNLRIDPALWERARAAANATDLSLTAWVAQAIVYALEGVPIAIEIDGKGLARAVARPLRKPAHDPRCPCLVCQRRRA